MAASTEEPCLLSTLMPRAVQWAASVTTAPCWKICRRGDGCTRLSARFGLVAAGPSCSAPNSHVLNSGKKANNQKNAQSSHSGFAARSALLGTRWRR